MTLPSFRNPYVSKLLNYLCVIDTLNILKLKISIVYTNSKIFAKLINRTFNRSNIEVRIKTKNSGSLQKFKNFFKSTIYQLIIFLFIKF